MASGEDLGSLRRFKERAMGSVVAVVAVVAKLTVGRLGQFIPGSSGMDPPVERT
jgi:hypothetical protein